MNRIVYIFLLFYCALTTERLTTVKTVERSINKVPTRSCILGFHVLPWEESSYFPKRKFFPKKNLAATPPEFSASFNHKQVLVA